MGRERALVEQGAGADHGALRALATTAISKNISVLPQFLAGGLAVLMREDLSFTEAQLGLIVSAFFAASAAGSVPGGRLSERIGAYPAMGLGAVGSAGCLLGIGLLAGSWIQVMLFMLLGGAANALAQPATNLALAKGIPSHWQGLAFGIKQAANPLATLLTGAAVPAIGLTVGWRWAFVGAAAAVVPLVLVSPVPMRPRTAIIRVPGGSGPAQGQVLQDRRSLLVLAAAAVFGTGASSAMAAFFVPSAVQQGHDPGTAGLWLAFGGACGVVARMFWGWLADRREGEHLIMVSWLMGIGALGFVALSASSSSLVLAAGSALAFGAAWAYPGLFVYAIVLHNKQAPAAATGVTQTGTFLGGMLGPAVFGALVQGASYATAWYVGAGSLLMAVGLVQLARRSLRHRSASGATEPASS